MSVTTLPDNQMGPATPREIRDDGAGVGIWALSALAILAVHAGALAWLVSRPPIEPQPIEEIPPAIMIELAPEPVPAPPAPPPPPPPPPEPEIIPEAPVLPAPEVELPKPPPPKPKPPEIKPQPRVERPPQKVVPKVETPVTDAPVFQAPINMNPAPAAAPAAPPSPQVSGDWKGTLIAHLERNKRYPRSAQQRGQQGTTVLRFIMDREGNVLSATIDRSSGFPGLDEEVLAMINRAQPLPKFPADYTEKQMELIVPIRFALR